MWVWPGVGVGVAWCGWGMGSYFIQKSLSLLSLSDLLSSLCVAYGARWQHIGTRLGLPNVLLDGIKGFSDDHRMLEVLLTWLGADPEASWSKLASALPQDLNRNDSGTNWY